MKDSNTVVITVIGALVIGAVSFFAGAHFAVNRFAGPWGNSRSQVVNHMGFTTRGMMGGKGANFVRGGPGANGEITKINGNTVTLKLPDGTTRDVTLTDQTVVDTMIKGTAKDLKIGQNVMVTGGGFWNSTQTIIVRP